MLIELPRWAQAFDPPARFKIAYGGRGSGKSWTIARKLLLLAIERPIRVLCARELQNSIQDSVHQLLADQARLLGIDGEFVIQEAKIRSRCGSEFLFKGLRGMKNNAQAIKSMEGIDICWIEEGQTISKASFETLTPTIRKAGAEIWITFNPDQVTDPVYQLINAPPEGAVIIKVNWSENPWFANTSLPDERDWMQRTDPDNYAHIWEGACKSYSNAQVLKNKIHIAAFTPGHDWDGPYFGADWGFSVDPTTLVKLWIYDNSLYVEHEAYGVGVEIDHTPDLFRQVPGAEHHVIRADNARPETISYMRRTGFNIRGAVKGKGSVEDGIIHLRGYLRIILHPRCIHAAEEARLWSYKTDRLSGDILPVLIDANNHIWDAARYALEPVMHNGLGGHHITTQSTTALSAW